MRRLLAPLPLMAWAFRRTASDGWRREALLFLILAPILAWTKAHSRPWAAATITVLAKTGVV